MAGRIVFENREIFVPGVYAATKVASTLPGAVRAFQVPVLLAGAHMGYPHDHQDKLLTTEASRLPLEVCSTDTEVGAIYGADSDLTIAFKQAKRVGLPYALCVCLSALTRGSAVVTSTGPVNQFTLYPRLLGTAPLWHKVKFTGGVWTTTPWTQFSLLTANGTSTATRIYCRDNTWAYAGLTVEVGDNDTANISRTVIEVGTELDPSTGQILYWLELDSALGASFTTAQYAAVAVYGTRTEVSSTLTTAQQLLDYLNGTTCTYWRGVKHADFTNALPISVSSSTAVKDISAWSTVTDGTSPAASATDVQTFLSWLAGGGNDEIIGTLDVIPRLFLLGMSSATAHGYLASYAADQRIPEVNRFPIAAVTGCGWGDVVLDAGDSTDPVFRANAIDSQDVQLVAGGVDRLAAYLSTAAQIWGLRAAGGVNHNLTADELKGVPEVRWSADDLQTLIRGGVTVARLFVTGAGNYLGVAQGNNTLQANTYAWNTVTNDTPLAQQRDLVDFIKLDQVLNGTEKLHGADSVDAVLVRAVYAARAQEYERLGYIQAGSYSITSCSLNSTGTGWDVADTLKTPVTADFITVTTTVTIGE